MRTLIKDFLEKERNHKDIDILYCSEDGHLCSVRFEYTTEFDDRKEVRDVINIWDVLAFVYQETKK